jgi:hypothetical protein
MSRETTLKGFVTMAEAKGPGGIKHPISDAPRHNHAVVKAVFGEDVANDLRAKEMIYADWLSEDPTRENKLETGWAEKHPDLSFWFVRDVKAAKLTERTGVAKSGVKVDNAATLRIAKDWFISEPDKLLPYLSEELTAQVNDVDRAPRNKLSAKVNKARTELDKAQAELDKVDSAIRDDNSELIELVAELAKQGIEEEAKKAHDAAIEAKKSKTKAGKATAAIKALSPAERIEALVTLGIDRATAELTVNGPAATV